METVFERRFDENRNIHYINDEPSVMHCHHYITRCTRLALDMEQAGGPRLLMEAMEEACYLALKKYFIRHDVTDRDGMVETAREYFRLSGLGTLTIQPGKESGSAEMTRSHLDEGWSRLWGASEEPVNYIGCGYLAAVFALLNSLPPRSYRVREDQSLARGDAVSRFVVELKKEPA